MSSIGAKKKPIPMPAATSIDRRSTLETNPPKSEIWWFDDTYADKPQPFSIIPRTAEFIAYRSFLIRKGPDELDGQTRRYMAALEDDCMQKTDELNEEFDELVDSYNTLEQEYDFLRDENTALQKQLADGDRKKLLKEIASLRNENAALQTQVAAKRTPDNEKLLEEIVELRERVREKESALFEAQAPVVQAVNIRDTGQGMTCTASFNINPRRLPTFDGTRDATMIADFLSHIKRAFAIRCQENGWLRDGHPESLGWSTYALGQLRGAAARWADSKYPSTGTGSAPTWADFERSLRAEFTPVRELLDKWTALRLPANGHVETFNEQFRELRQHLDLFAEHALSPVQTLQAYMQKVRSNSKADEHLTMYVESGQDMGLDITLECAMRYTAMLDRKEAPKDKAAEIATMYMPNNSRRVRDRKNDDGNKPTGNSGPKINFSSVVPGGKGLGLGVV